MIKMEFLTTLIQIPTWIYVLISLLPLCYVYLTWTFNYWEKRGVPGNKPRLFLGTVKPFWNINSRLEDQDMECLKEHGRFYGCFENRIPILRITDPHLIRQITVKDFAYFPNRRQFDLHNKYLNKMLSVLRDDEWKLVRNTLSPAYTTGKLKQMVSLIEESVTNLIKSLEPKSDNEEFVEMTDHFSVLTLDVIATCAFGMKIDCIKNPHCEFVTKAKKAFRAPPIAALIMVVFGDLFKFVSKLLFKILVKDFEYFVDVAHTAIDVRMQNKEISRQDFLELMLDAEVQDESDTVSAENLKSTPNRKTLTHDVVVAQTILFILAGHESTANTLAFLSYELAMNPQIQDKLIAEIDDVMNECKGNLSYEIIASMQYIDMVLSEILRLHPPAIRIDRVCETDQYLINGVTIDKGILIEIPVYAIHHDPEFYPDPEVFDPNRFSPENKAKRNPFTYIPFGVGPRTCIAMRFALMEVKISLILLLHKFRFASGEKTDFPLKFLPGVMGFHQPKSVNLQLQKRIDQPQFN